MAELPDLTVFAEILTRRFRNKTLDKLEVKVPTKLNFSTSELISMLEGKELSSVSRYGKTLHFHFGEHVLQIHLMLRGEIAEIEKKEELPKHVIIAFHFIGSDGFAIVDVLKQARTTLNPEKVKVPDALEMKLEYFSGVLAKSKKKIKEVMMDQQKMRGIGNSYADEILWDARISPFSLASSVPENVVKKLLKSLRSVLKDAITSIAKENGDELRGELRDFMKVHSAKLKNSPNGGKIKSEKIGGRSTYYTDEQTLYS